MPLGITRRREAKAARRKKVLEDRRKQASAITLSIPKQILAPGYDPAKTPDPTEWLARDEQERQILVSDFHRRARIRLPNGELHAIFHVIIENQIALGDDLPVRRAMERLMGEGLDRHEALHAVASILTELVYDVTHGKDPGPFPQEAYNAAVEKLTAESWRRRCESKDD
jgi:hypothetical protein